MPLAVRYFAASLYAFNSGYLFSAYDWAAQSLAVSAPPLFDGHSGTAHADNPAVSPPPTQEDMGNDAKPKVTVFTCAPWAVGGYSQSSPMSPDPARFSWVHFHANCLE